MVEYYLSHYFFFRVFLDLYNSTKKNYNHLKGKEKNIVEIKKTENFFQIEINNERSEENWQFVRKTDIWSTTNKYLCKFAVGHVDRMRYLCIYIKGVFFDSIFRRCFIGSPPYYFQLKSSEKFRLKWCARVCKYSKINITLCAYYTGS